MMVRSKSTMILLAAGSLLFASDQPKQKAVVTDTQHLDFAPGGQLRLKHSTGEVTIEGWDQPGAEITTTKSSKRDYDARDRGSAAHDLDKVRVISQRQGDDLVIVTEFPRHHFPPPSPWGSAVDFHLQYNIKVPRNARVTVDHNIGEVNIYDIAGEIRVAEKQGLILLHLAENRQYAIDAKSGLGSVNSDFPGAERRTPLLPGHSFTENVSGSAQKLHLRTRYGDIIILGERIPAYPGSAAH